MIDWEQAINQAFDDDASLPLFEDMIKRMPKGMTPRLYRLTLSDADRQFFDYWFDKLLDWACEKYGIPDE